VLYFSPWKTFGIWLIVGIGILFTLPNMLPQSVWRHSRIGCPGRR